jgi:hydroxyacylglutathione hydrolase
LQFEYAATVTLEQFYLGCLSHASYLAGSEGIAAVVDPQRDVDTYLDAANRLGLRIEHIIETHLHADFVSGHRELAARTGATIYLGEGSGASFPHRGVRDGDEIALGACRLRFLQTPGHTLESISVVVLEGEKPSAVFTGDTMFIGDVGRPDLCDSRSPVELAGMLYDSLHGKLLTLPDEVRVYPAHGAGSMCGRNISAERSSTIGRERLSNYALQPMSRERFVGLMTSDLPPRPEYFRSDVDANRHGAAALRELPPLATLDASTVAGLQAAGTVLLDTRPAALFCSGFVPGSLGIGLRGELASWSGVLLGTGRDLVIVAEDPQSAAEARLRLARVGIERVRGVLDGGIAAWARAGLPLAWIGQIAAVDLSAETAAGNGLALVDVRTRAEWDKGHLPGAVHHPLDRLSETLGALDPGRPTAVHCKGGYRSAIACSILAAHGFGQLLNVIGGFDAWTAAGLPSEKAGAAV